MAITWNNTMTTGVKEVDDQHRDLIDKVNQLADAMGKGKGREEIVKMIDFLGAYVVKHFADEERQMERYQCPVAAENKKAHQEFVATFQSFRKRLDAQGATFSLVVEMLPQLTEWLTKHIVRIDAKLLPCVQSKQPKPAMALAR